MHDDARNGGRDGNISLQARVQWVVGVGASRRPGERCQQGSNQQHHRGDAWRSCHGARGPPAAGGARVAALL